jgi:hypothetical protein
LTIEERRKKKEIREQEAVRLERRALSGSRAQGTRVYFPLVNLPDRASLEQEFIEQQKKGGVCQRERAAKKGGSPNALHERQSVTSNVHQKPTRSAPSEP